jgi:hypothetical protein
MKKIQKNVAIRFVFGFIAIIAISLFVLVITGAISDEESTVRDVCEEGIDC